MTPEALPGRFGASDDDDRAIAAHAMRELEKRVRDS
jgi:hypothetical protein